jgi:hypothetical protein
MPVLSMLLRLTLSVVLILNGVGTALAGTRMQLEQDVHARHAAQASQPAVDAQAEPPCHQHQHAAASPAPVEKQAAAVDATEKSKTPAAPDCCKSANCGCACMYTVAGVVVSPLLRAVFSPHAVMASAGSSGHHAPSLPQLIRPPIG